LASRASVGQRRLSAQGVEPGGRLINPLIISPLYDAEDFAVEGLCLQ
jgi:hypothetical protein